MDQVSINVQGGGSSQIPIAARDMTVYWQSSAHRPDISLVIRHGDDEINLAPAEVAQLAIEVYNYGKEARQLDLMLLDLPAEVWKLREPSVRVEPGNYRTVRASVVCEATVPPAGPGSIKVRAVDAKTGEPFYSDRRAIRVRPKPGLKLSLDAPATRRPNSNVYEAVVSVRNAGNVHVRGTLRVASDAGRGTLEPGVALAPPRLAECLGEFDLAPDENGPVKIVMRFGDRAPLDRRWRVPLRPETGRDDVEVWPGHIDVVEQGLLPELMEALPVVRQRLAEGASRLLRWSRRDVTLARGWLLAAAVAVLLTSVVALASTGGGAGRASSTPSTAAPRPSLAADEARPAELAAYRADWPGLACDAEAPGAGGPRGQRCHIGGIELFLWLYGSHEERNKSRQLRAGAAARTDTCAPGARQGTWSGTAGRGGTYVETWIRDERGECWARIWWDGGDSDPKDAVALMLSAKWDADLHGSWDPLRTVWLSHGYQFTP